MLKHLPLVQGFVALALATSAAAGTFEAIMNPTCINTTSVAQGSFSTGEQYTDLNNGVKFSKWFMLSRWQGANEQDFVSNPVVYDVGAWTGLHGAPYQRGVAPENSAGSPAVQLSCYDSGMLINTWGHPHRPIVGGGYNGMMGYQFSLPNRPYAFVKNGLPTHLVLQSNVAVPWYSVTHRPGTNQRINGQAGLFVYLRDISHSSFAPIVVLAMTHMSNLTEQPSFPLTGSVGFDYSSADTNTAKSAYPAWLSSAPSNGSGVWFVAAPISSNNNQRYVTKIFSDGDLNSNLTPLYNLNVPLLFWRAHITPSNLTNIVNDINVAPCGLSCPSRPSGGYSTNPNNWVVEYAGVIAETVLDSNLYDQDRTNWGGNPSGATPYNDTTKDQVSLGVHVYAPGIYRYYP